MTSKGGESEESEDPEASEEEEAPEPEAADTAQGELVSPLQLVKALVEEAVDNAANGVVESPWTGGTSGTGASATAQLMSARNTFTGTKSDRQEMGGGSISDMAEQLPLSEMTQEDAQDLVANDYPGKEYRLTFQAGEEAKYLVITPKYSDAAEGDATIMLTLESPSTGVTIGEDTNPVIITIVDEDEPEPVVINMAEDTVIAKDGKASITVTRQGRINTIVGVRIATYDGSAAQGDEYSGVGAKLYFPMGIESRTVDIPVYHGDEEKDFYVTITPLEQMKDLSVNTATTHVIIPSAETVNGEGELMDDRTIEGRPITDAINIKGGSFDLNGEYTSDTSAKIWTNTGKPGEYARCWIPTAQYGYAYDGVWVDYTSYTSWCKGNVWISFWYPTGKEIDSNSHNRDGTYSGGMLGYWGREKAPDKITIEAKESSKEGWRWSDDYIDVWLEGVHLIARNFNISVEPAEVKPLVGVEDDYVLHNYEAVFLDKSSDATRSLYTDDSFAITAKDTKSPLRLVGIEAKIDGTNAWYRIATIDGKSSTATVEMNANLINTLQNKGCITWSKNGSNPTHGGDSFQGDITVRPVFDYINATVEVQKGDNDYGTLAVTSPQPSMLWDFNSDNAMSSHMGGFSSHTVSYKGAKSGSDDYYTFTASGRDPYVSIDNAHAESVDNIQWVKVRARTNSGNKMQLFASLDNAMPNGNATTDIGLTKDGQWHEYVINIPEANKATQKLSQTAWQGTVTWLRLDPLDGCSSGATIDIDYVAFFPDEESAKAFRSADSTDGDYTVAPGTYTYHLGDRVNFKTELNAAGREANMTGDGVYYELRLANKTGTLKNHNDVHYINKTIDFQISGNNSAGQVVDKPYYRLKPTFTEGGNRVMVRVPDLYYNTYLNTEEGLFSSDFYISRNHANGYWEYILDEDILTNEIYELRAYTKDRETVVPKWTLKDGSEFFGDTLYIRSNPKAADNVVTLEAAAGKHLTYMTLSGTVVSSTYNLSTSRSATNQNAVEGATVSIGNVGAVTDENGEFTLPALLYDSDSTVRYTVTYNGQTTIQEARVPGNSATKVSATTLDGKSVQAADAYAGAVRLSSFNETGAHFVSAYANQIGQLVGAVNAVTMNGRQLTVNLQVAQGGDYVMGGKTYTEHIKEVRVWFQDQVTGEVHLYLTSNTKLASNSLAKYSWNENTGLFTLIIDQFDPEHPESWTYGDVLMAQIVTDKKTPAAFAADADMVYDPVSTGYGVYVDPDYEPQTFQYDVENMANMFAIEPVTDEDGKLLADDEDDTRYSFGTFPYIGEITALVHIFSRVVNSATMSEEGAALLADLEAMAPGEDEEGDLDFGDDGVDVDGTAMSGNGQYKEKTNVGISVFVKITDTKWGNVRFMIGAIVSYGGGNGYKRQSNPYQNIADMKVAKAISVDRQAVQDANSSAGMAYDQSKVNKGTGASTFGGGYFKIAVYFGVYFDYGYIETSKNGGAQVSHDMIYMGAGGFIGFTGSLGYTQPFIIPPSIPAYFNFEFGADLTFFMGSEGDPKATLEHAKKTKELKGQDFKFMFEFEGRIYVTATLGWGFFKCFGLRATAGVAFEFGYSNRMVDWYPNLFDTGWGDTMEATFAGTIDLVVTSIDLYSASWPLPVGGGFMYYFQETRRANRCIKYVEAGISKGKGSASARKEAREWVDSLKKMVDGEDTAAKYIEATTYSLNDYAYKNGIIDYVAHSDVLTNKQGGIVGNAYRISLNDDEDGSGVSYHTNDHVNSQWVAGQGGELMAAYQAVSSYELQKDAYSQPSSRILAIDDTRYLMVFLGDPDETRDRQQAAAVMWTIYDASKNTWTTPQMVQDDRTLDSKPDLVDAGDKIILSWSSITDAKYNQLKKDVAKEIGSGATDLTVQDALEKDPTRVMNCMDIFSVEFDKASGTFGSITQLTDDDFYDDYPTAVYDEETGDYIVLYYKTAQDDKAYDDPGDKLLDMVGIGADPEKTYGVIAYMLYNGTQESGDAHKVGWVRDYYYDTEKSDAMKSYSDADMQAYLERWGGQRFLESVIQSEDVNQTDPPIGDLTAAGYNGIATLAYTVDTNFDLSTAEDRNLYVQVYDFADHRMYVPIQVAGTVTDEREIYDAETDTWQTVQSVRQVEVGTPRIIRNGGDTFLFWRQDGDTLEYLNLSEMVTDKVATTADPGENDWTYAVKDNGSFATDASTGLVYTPKVEEVDFGSALTDSGIEITDYEVITDQDDNLYVVWTDTVTHMETNEDSGESYPVTAQEIYASAKIKQTEKKVSESGETGTTQTARWSKPYRLTRENNFNDGLALALDPEGGLLIVHNQYSKLMAQSEEEAIQLMKEGKIGTVMGKDPQTGEDAVFAVSLAYNSPISLMVTRCDAVGSLEATTFEFSDDHPVGGQAITVRAAIENVGLTDAAGCQIDFYEYKNGKQGKKIYSISSDDPIQVNTAQTVKFRWTVPEEGPDGYSIQAVVTEKKAGGGAYDAVESYSGTFEIEPVLDLSVHNVVQEGDHFRVDYEVQNAGNADAAEGTSVGIRLVGLYGDLDSDRYGHIRDNEIYRTEVASELPAKLSATDVATLANGKELDASMVFNTSFEESVLVDIPTSLFHYCGYDAIQLVILDENGSVVEESPQYFVSLDQPVNLSLNEGNDVSLKADNKKQVTLDYDRTAFMEEETVVYNVDDPSVATVDKDGVITGVKNGTTTVTATLLPSGRSESVTVRVSGGSSGSSSGSEANDVTLPDTIDGGDATSSLDKAREGQKVTITVEPEEGYEVSIVRVKDANGKSLLVTDNGDGTYTFTMPDSAVTVDPVFVRSGSTSDYQECQKDKYCPIYKFNDASPTAWYHDGVHWALEEGIMKGIGDGKFAPNDPTTRAMIVTMLWRLQGEPAGSGGPDFQDLEEGSWYEAAVEWAAANEIVKGYSDEAFGPMDPVTREQLATILYRYADFTGRDVSEMTYLDDFEDADTVSAWAKDALQWAVAKEIIQGVEEGILSPQTDATRAQVATMLMRYSTKE